jgi:hypothetical protein
MLFTTQREDFMPRILKRIAAAAALLSAITVSIGLTAGPASAARAVGFDSTHTFHIDTTFSNGQLLQCSTDPFTGTGTVRVSYPDKIYTPVSAWSKVYFSANLQRYVNGQPVLWGETKPWYYNYATSSGYLYFPLYVNLSTGAAAYALTVGWTSLPAGFYRLNLQFFWGYDSRQAVYETDWCRVG